MPNKTFTIIIDELYQYLNKNEIVKAIYDTEINNASLDYYINNSAFFGISWKRVLDKLFITANYLKSFAFINDDFINDDFKLTNNINDLLEFPLDEIGKFDNPAFNFKMLKTHVMLLLFAVSARATKRINNLIDDDLNLRHLNHKVTYYRGHEDKNYQLIPSIFRKINYALYKDRVFDYNSLLFEYKNKGLIGKYDKIFKTRFVDYNFCSFMQHSTSFSPLLDLTLDHIIGLSFATSSYTKCPVAGSLLRFSFNDKVKEVSRADIKNVKTYLFNTKLNPSAFVGAKRIYYCTPKDFEPTVELVKNMTNDRMKYQLGSFLFFRFCVIVNGIILMPYKIGNIIEYIIDPSEKSKIYNKITTNYSYYDIDHLLDPYKYFKEQ